MIVTKCDLREPGLKHGQTKNVGLHRTALSNQWAPATCGHRALAGRLVLMETCCECKIHTNFEDSVQKENVKCLMCSFYIGSMLK